LNVAEYRAIETLRDGRPIQIRGLRPYDRAALLTAVGQSSPRSLYRRFFSLKRDFTEEEIARYVNVDFVNHVALVAALDEGGREIIIAGGRYVLADPETAELAFVVIDQFQRQGVGAALLRHLTAIARSVGLKELTAEVLAENIPMLKVFERSGLCPSTTREAGVVHVALKLR
jgi:GNAT superfamily N-acetyltransferase